MLFSCLSSGREIYFRVDSLRKNAIVLNPNVAALSRGCKPRIVLFKVDRLQIILVAKKYISTFRNCSSV